MESSCRSVSFKGRDSSKNDASCAVCGAEDEFLFHLCEECPGARSFAFACNWGFRLDNWRVNSIIQIVESCISPVEDHFLRMMDSNSIMMFLYTFLFHCWMFRNKMVHSGEVEFFRKIAMLN